MLVAREDEWSDEEVSNYILVFLSVEVLSSAHAKLETLLN